MGWQEFMEGARTSARQVEVLTYRINNGGRDWTSGGVRTHTANIAHPTASAAIMELTVVPQLVEQREHHERVVGEALTAIGKVRSKLGVTEADILEMFYIDGFLTWEIAGELGLTVDGVFYRKRRTLA
jgi:hypothetical protein